MATPTERDDTILILRRELKARTGRAWSVTGGRGTAWGWITVTAPPARRLTHGEMTEADIATLADVFGERVHAQGISIPDSREYRTNYVDAVRGLPILSRAEPYWD